MAMAATAKDRIAEVLADDQRVLAAMNRGVREALVEHHRLGRSVVIYRDGQIIEVPPEEIPALLEPK